MTSALDAIIGTSSSIVALRTLISTVAPTRLPVLIEGPTGAGKELVAAALHALSGRRGGFVPFNACAISDTMFEDALFGHIRGAFTGASSDSPGYLREADGGTLFLDEVGSLSALMQAKLLRAIELGQFRPVGAPRDVTSEFRTVSATNEPMVDLRKSGRFREDLAHRMTGVLIAVPPLSERREDIAMLARHFLARVGFDVGLTPDAVAVLEAHEWPGNIRELKNVVEVSVALGGVNARTIAAVLAQRSQPCDTVAYTERERLRAVLDAHGWDADATAGTLGVHRATVYRWIRMWDLSHPSRDSRTRDRNNCDNRERGTHVTAGD